MNKINELVISLNSWNKFGSVYVSDYNDVKDGIGFDELGIDDVVISYDWMSDDMSDDEKVRFENWLYNNYSFWDRMRIEMRKLGYEGVHEMDGSGNGLYYGCEVFRKI